MDDPGQEMTKPAKDDPPPLPKGFSQRTGFKGLVNRLLKGDTDDTLIQMFRYLQVAFLAFLVDFGALYLFTEFGGLHYLVSNALAFVLGVSTNYLLSIRWVFKNSALKDRKSEAVIFVAIGVAGLGLNEVFIWFFTEVTHLHYMISKIISTGVVFFFNFFVRKFMLFNKKEQKD